MNAPNPIFGQSAHQYQVIYQGENNKGSRLYKNPLTQLLGHVEQKAVSSCDFFVNQIFLLKNNLANSEIKRSKDYQKWIDGKVKSLQSQKQKINQSLNSSAKNSASSISNIPTEDKIKNIQQKNIETSLGIAENEKLYTMDRIKWMEKQEKSFTTRVLKSVAWITSPVTLALFGAGALLSGIAMVILRASLNPFKAEFIYLEPTRLSVINEINTDTPGLTKNPVLNKKFTMASQNIALSRYNIMNSVNQLASSKERVSELIDNLLKKDKNGDQKDVICLQEAFHDEVIIDEVAKRLQDSGYYIVYPPKPKFGMLSSGLLLASKYPITDFAFMPYARDKLSTNHNYYADKGVLAAIIDIGDGRKIEIATTHAMCGLPLNAQEKQQAYRSYMLQAKEFMHDFRIKNDASDTLFCGDLNMHVLQYEKDENLFVNDISKGDNNELAALTEENFRTDNSFKFLNHAEPLVDEQGKELKDDKGHIIYKTNELGESGLFSGTSVDRKTPTAHLGEENDPTDVFTITEDQRTLDHFALNAGENSIFKDAKFKLEKDKHIHSPITHDILTDHFKLDMSFEL